MATEFEKQLPAFRLAEIHYNDTLQKIATRELGDANRWAEILWINNLIYPYLTGVEEEAGDRVLLFGSKIRIPTATKLAANVGDNIYERDILLRNKKLLSNGSGDLLIASGTDNLNQQILNKINTPRGRLSRHPKYGCLAWSILGTSDGAIGSRLASQFVKTAILSDYRVASAKSVTAKVIKSAIDIKASVNTIAGDKIDIVDGNEEVIPDDEVPISPVAPPPLASPTAVSVRSIFEASYYDFVRSFGLSPATDDTYVGVMAESPSFSSVAYKMSTRLLPAGFVTPPTVHPFSEHGILSAAINKTDTTLSITGLSSSVSISAGDPVYIDDEVFRVASAAIGLTTTIVVSRGCADSVPEAHDAGADVWLPVDSEPGLSAAFSDGDSVDVRLLTVALTGTLSASLAAIDNVTLANRIARPYPPGKLRIDGSVYPADGMNSISLSWKHRDRTAQTSALVNTEADNIGPEFGTTYSLRLLRADNFAILDSVTDVAGTSSSLSSSTFTGDVIVELWSVRDGLESMQRHHHEMFYFANAPRATEADEFRITEDDKYRIVE